LNVPSLKENSTLGGVWSVGYRSLHLQTQAILYEFPNFPFPKTKEDYPTQNDVEAYLQSYAQSNELIEKIEFNSEVKKMERRSSGRPGWRLTIQKDSKNVEHEFDFVVISSGLYSNPSIPNIRSKTSFEGQIMHSSEYQEVDVSGKKVVVVGAGKSAVDVVTDAQKSGAESVTMVLREAHWPVPQKVLGLIPVQYIFVTRFASSFLPLYQRPGPWEWGLHTIGKPLVWAFWRAVELLVRAQFGIGWSSPMSPTAPLESDLYNGDFLPNDDFYPLTRSGKLNFEKTTIDSFTENGLKLNNGKEIAADLVVFATGWQQSLSLFPADIQNKLSNKDGVYLYRHVVHPDVPDVAFIGWASTFSNTLTDHIQSRWLVEVLKETLLLPSPDAQRQEIEKIKVWKRGFMPECNSRGALLQVHMIHYHDEMLKDIGENPRYKSNPIAELLGAYQPADYNKIIAKP